MEDRVREEDSDGTTQSGTESNANNTEEEEKNGRIGWAAIKEARTAKVIVTMRSKVTKDERKKRKENQEQWKRIITLVRVTLED